MAKAYRKHVIVTHGKEYGINDPIILRLKNGVILTGIIKDIRFDIGHGSWIDLYINYGEITGEITIDVEKIDD